MPFTTIYRGLIGRILFDGHGERVGLVHTLYLDTFTGRPEWASVEVNGVYRLVPLGGTSPYLYDSDVSLQTAYTTAFIEDGPPIGAPPIPPDAGEIDDATVEAVFAHYGFDIQSPVYGPTKRIDADYEVVPMGTVEAKLLSNGARLRQYLVADQTQINADP